MFSNLSHPGSRPVSIALALSCIYSATLFLGWSATAGNRNLFAVALVAPLIWLTLADLNKFVIPNLATLSVAAIGLVKTATGEPVFSVTLELLSASVVLVLFWLIGEIMWRRTGNEALGIGDAKLMAAGVLCVGILQFWLVLLLASIGGIVFLVVSRKVSTGIGSGVAFGPFLAFAIFLVFLVGEA